MVVTDFTPIPSLVGGVMIGAAAVTLMLATGRIAGVSGFVSRLLPPYDDKHFAVRAAFVAGLVVAPFVYALCSATEISHRLTSSVPLLISAGLMVGVGSVVGSGCTSGHGVCGLARRSSRSFVATATFMIAAMATVFLTRHVLGV